ncbi:MAG: biotin--[acetyl-CoA-carboxylase] ligase [Streptosporangiaceae bacterium]
MHDNDGVRTNGTASSPAAGFWQPPVVLPETGSTNTDLLAAARGGAPDGSVLVADVQTAGRGRLARNWVTVPGAALACSVLLRPAGVPVARRGWLPLLAGVAVAAAVRAAAGVEAGLKWPNDVLAGGGKLAGILAEQYQDAVVIGIGLNLTAVPAASPAGTPGPVAPGSPACGPGALAPTSLAAQGASRVGRDEVLAAVLDQLGRRYLRWRDAVPPGDPQASGLRAEYLRYCLTIGRDVRVEMPGGRVLAGRAADVDADGRLVVDTTAGPAAVSAGDVVHLR